MNKMQGRKISRIFRNKSRKTSKASYCIQVDDEELATNNEVSSPQHVSPYHISSQEPSENLAKEKEKERTETSPNLEISFWKDKYYSVVPVLQANIIDLELENQLLRSDNRALIDSQRRQVSGFKEDKKKDAVNINSPGVNIFVNSDFKTVPSNTQC
jgi:hypothetical protein